MYWRRLPKDEIYRHTDIVGITIFLEFFIVHTNPFLIVHAISLLLLTQPWSERVVLNLSKFTRPSDAMMLKVKDNVNNSEAINGKMSIPVTRKIWLLPGFSDQEDASRDHQHMIHRPGPPRSRNLLHGCGFADSKNSVDNDVRDNYLIHGLQKYWLDFYHGMLFHYY